MYSTFLLQAAALNDHIELMHPTRVPPKKSEKERLVWKTLADDIDRRQPHYMPGQLVNAHLARTFLFDDIDWIGPSAK